MLDSHSAREGGQYEAHCVVAGVGRGEGRHVDNRETVQGGGGANTNPVCMRNSENPLGLWCGLTQHHTQQWLRDSNRANSADGNVSQ